MQSKRIMMALLAAGVGLGAAPAGASDAERIAALEKQLKLLQEQIEALKKSTASQQEVADLRDQMAVQSKENVVAGDISGSFRVPGSEVSLRPYGIAELNMVHSLSGDSSDVDYSTFLPYVPLRGSAAGERKGQNFLHARTSRIGLEAATPSPFGMITAKVEGDFNNEPRTGNSAVYGSVENIFTQQQTNSYGFRLRHAYVQGGSWLFGQTWSTFMDVDNTPETVDFNGPIGSTFIRQPMIRYTYPTPQFGNFTAAVENSVSYVLDVTGSATTAGFSKVPDLVLRWDKSFTWGTLSLRGVMHEHRLDGDVVVATDDPATPADESASATLNKKRRGWGVSASGQIKSVGDDFFTWIVTGGEGIGRYFNYIEGAGYDPAGDRIVMEKAVGVVLGYQHKPSPGLRFNFVGAYQKNFDNEYTDWARTNGLDSGQFGVNRKAYQLHAGGFWNPTKVMELGLEYMYGQRQTLVGEKGDLSRVNFLARYYLN